LWARQARQEETMKRKSPKLLDRLEQEREYAKESIVLAACVWAQELLTANDAFLKEYVKKYQDANRRFEAAMGGGFQ
jgi:hypothetical protein